MTDELTKIDRWNSEHLDVHTWSDHPESKTNKQVFEEVHARGTLRGNTLDVFD